MEDEEGESVCEWRICGTCLLCTSLAVSYLNLFLPPPPPLQISSCIQDLQELKAHTPTEHVDYNILHDVITELEIIQKVKTTTASRKTYPQAMSLSGSSK